MTATLTTPRTTPAAPTKAAPSATASPVGRGTTLIHRLLIAHPSRLAGESLVTALRLLPEVAEARLVHDMTVVEETASAWHPTQILLAGTDGIDHVALADRLSRTTSVKGIVIVAGNPSRVVVDAALRNGRISPLSHQTSSARLVHTLLGAARGFTCIDPTFMPDSEADPCPLTDREREVLVATLRGETLADIALAMFLAPGTVRNISSNAIKKLGTRNRTAAAHRAHAKGWL